MKQNEYQKKSAWLLTLSWHRKNTYKKKNEIKAESLKQNKTKKEEKN